MTSSLQPENCAPSGTDSVSLCFSESHVDQLVDAGPARRLGRTLSLSVSVKATWISWLMQGQRAVWDGLCLSLFQ